MRKKLYSSRLVLALSALLCAHEAGAQVPDSAVEPGYRPNQPDTLPVPKEEKEPLVTQPSKRAISAAPEHAKTIFLELKGVRFDGATAFSTTQLSELYAKYLNTKVSLDLAWKIAAELTELYRKNGYFLSIAYVPAQQVKDGIIKIKVVEGYVGAVQLQGDFADNYVVRQHIAHLKAQHPIKASDLESFILRIRDLGGLSFKGVLASVKEEVKELVEYRNSSSTDAAVIEEVIEEGAVKLVLVPSRTDWKATVSFDNYGSMFYNPHNLSIYTQHSFLPLHQTSISGLLSVPTEQFQFASVDHTINILRNVNLDMHAEKQASEPTYTLKKLKMTGAAEAYGVALNYSLFRQRNFNMSFKLALDARDGQSKSLGFVNNVDKMRAVRFGTNVDWIDSFYGFSHLSVRATQGLKGMGASKPGKKTVRENTKPDFFKVDASIARLQGINKHWFIYGSLAGQHSKDVVFSSEEFGYGGRQFGRAFDSNDFKGFKGYAYSLELRYEGIPKISGIGLHPYGFYDAGKVWSRAKSSTVEIKTAASAGFGMRFDTWFNMNGNVGLAFPVDHTIPFPIYNASKRGPRMIFSVSKTF
jgi:hemolysin activation/secretion protein